MPRLRLSDLHRYNEALLLLYAEPGPTPLFTHLSQAVLHAVDAEVASFDGYDLIGSIGPLGSFPQTVFSPELFPVLAEFLPEHPLFPTIMLERSTQPLRTSDYCRMTQFYRTTLYNEFYRPFSLTHSIVMGLDVADYGWITFAISRNHRDFSRAEKALIGLLQPHFQTAVRHARVLARLQPENPAQHHLTPRETSLLTLLAQGLTDKEISQRCRISVRTVQNHLQNIYAKLGVGNRTAALACLRQPS